MRVAVVGTGYVGLVTGVVLADLGNDVVCVDRDAAKVAGLREGRSPIYEPGIEELIARGLREERLSFATSAAEAVRDREVVFIAVGTPPGPDGTPDVTAVQAVAREIAPSLPEGVVVVNKSTVPVGSGTMVEDLLLENGAREGTFHVVSNPEFLREGSAIHDTFHPDRIVIGARTREAAQRLIELYEPLGAPVQVTDVESAELIKYASNAFLATKISFANMVAQLCEQCGANVADVTEGMGRDARIGSAFLGAGLGWGGSCFPKDVEGLIAVGSRYGVDMGLLREAQSINEAMTHRFLDRLAQALGGFAGKRIGVMGLAFKPNTDDIRDAKSLVVLERVLSEGGAVAAFDPIATDRVRPLFPSVEYVPHVYDLSNGADALVLVTEWNEFRQLDLARLAAPMRRKLLFDGRRVVNRAAAERAGFELHTIGSR